MTILLLNYIGVSLIGLWPQLPVTADAEAALTLQAGSGRRNHFLLFSQRWLEKEKCASKSLSPRKQVPGIPALGWMVSLRPAWATQ